MNKNWMVLAILGVAAFIAMGIVGRPAIHAQADDDKASSMPMCKMMAEKMEDMKAKRQAMNAELEEQVQEMEQAQGDAKVAAMAEVVKMLVEQRQQMMGMHQTMCQNMMGHMGDHMKSSMDGQAQQSMQGCPMMQKMQQGDSPQ